MFDFNKTIRTALVGALALAAVSGPALANGKHENQPQEEVVVEEPTGFENGLEVLFINFYTSSLVDLYVTNIQNDDWGQSLVDGYILRPGWEIVLDIYDGADLCEFDVRAEFADGEVIELWSADFCYYDTVNLQI